MLKAETFVVSFHSLDSFRDDFLLGASPWNV